MQSSNARWASSSGSATETGAWLGQLSSGSAVQRGSRDKPQLTFSTGLVVRHPATRAANAASTASPASRAVVTGSALETTARARMTSPPSSTTSAWPSPGRIAATGTPAASWAPASRAASAMANEIRPMPPST